MQFESLQRSFQGSQDSSVPSPATGSTPTDPFHSFSPTYQSGPQSVTLSKESNRAEFPNVAEANSISSVGIEERNRKEKDAMLAAPYKKPKSERSGTVPSKANAPSKTVVTKTTNEHLARTIDLLNYPDALQILASQDAGSVRFFWVFVILGLLGLSVYQVFYLVYALVKEESGTRITYMKIDKNFVETNFTMKVCSDQWPNLAEFEALLNSSDQFRPIMSHFDTDDLSHAFQLILQNQLSDSNVADTIKAMPASAKPYNDLEIKVKAELLKLHNNNLTKTIEEFARLLATGYMRIDGLPKVMQGLGGVGRQFCIKRQTEQKNVTQSHLAIYEEFPIGAGGDEDISKRPKLINAKFTLYSGAMEDSLSAAHFNNITQPIGYYRVDMKKYKFLNRNEAPCKDPGVDAVYPKGFAQSLCQEKCWQKAYEEVNQCSKLKIPEPGQPAAKLNKKLCQFPKKHGKPSDYRSEWEKVKQTYKDCAVSSKCNKEQFCTEYELTIQLVQPTPVATHCFIDSKETEINAKKCNSFFYMFVFNNRIQFYEEFHRHSILSVLSDSGGQIGLWIGFSVLEMAKMFFHWIIKMRNRRRIRKSLEEKLSKDKTRKSTKEQDKATVDTIMAARDTIVAQNAFEQSRLGLGIGSNLNYMGSHLNQISNQQMMNMIVQQGLTPVPVEDPLTNAPQTNSYFNGTTASQSPGNLFAGIDPNTRYLLAPK